MKSIAFFDFDGTLTTNDSLIKFIRLCKGDFNYLFGLFILLPVLVLYKLKIIPNYKAKEKMLIHFFSGVSEKYFKEIAREYSLNYIDRIIRDNAMKKLNWHKKQGHEVLVVSASLECWLQPWCDKNNIKLLATKIEIKDNIVTGKLITKNCYGIEKVNRIKEIYDLNKYDEIYAYGDTRGDKEMIELADEDKRFYRCF